MATETLGHLDNKHFLVNRSLGYLNESNLDGVLSGVGVLSSGYSDSRTGKVENTYSVGDREIRTSIDPKGTIWVKGNLLGMTRLGRESWRENPDRIQDAVAKAVKHPHKVK